MPLHKTLPCRWLTEPRNADFPVGAGRLENRRYPHEPVWEYVGTAKKEFAYDGPGPLRVRKRVERR
ncbi:MAG: hypothetical protein KJ070_15455 [Verrucomicrobia bacterium]|nr:hypothetical protein [Verrucomicrobiota bacterium]